MVFLNKLWFLLLEMSPYLLFGFLISGILSVLLTIEMVTKYLGKNNFRSIFLASLFGVPLPLCSCGVIPVFSYLKKHGASKASTTSFLISTPQTGVDSIMVTYSLLGPIFAIFRPIIAFISGIIGGLLIKSLDSEDTLKEGDESCVDECCDDESHGVLYRILNYGFIKLAQDIGFTLVVGLLIAALISIVIPDDYFVQVGTGILGMFIMLILGIPSYICATASVPIALMLHLKGFSMGSLIVFLMSGPATNMATISISFKQLGKKATMIYLISIIICSMVAGLLFDMLFPGLTVEYSLSEMSMLPYSIQLISAIILIGILLNVFRLHYFSKNVVLNSDMSIHIEGMTCNHCVETVKKSLNKIAGVNVVNIDLKTGKIDINCSNEKMNKVKSAIEDLGYKIK